MKLVRHENPDQAENQSCIATSCRKYILTSAEEEKGELLGNSWLPFVRFWYRTALGDEAPNSWLFCTGDAISFPPWICLLAFQFGRWIQGVDITIPVTCSVFEPDPMTSQCTRGVPRLKFGHKIHEMWVFFSFVAIASQKFYRRVAKHHCCFISHGATPGADDVTGQGDLAGWPYLYYRALVESNKIWRVVVAS